jgi:hypothetical protein
MIYATTHRSSWSARRLVPKFGATTLLCGMATVLWASAASSMFAADHARSLTPSFAVSNRMLLIAFLFVSALKLLAEADAFRNRRGGSDHKERARVARLLVRDLRRTATQRFVLGGIGGLVLPVVLAASGAVVPGSWIGLLGATAMLVCITAGELLERSLFFTTASAPTMRDS